MNYRSYAGASTEFEPKWIQHVPGGDAISYDEDDDVHDTDDNNGDDDDNDNGGDTDNGKGNGSDHYLSFAFGTIVLGIFPHRRYESFVTNPGMCGSAGFGMYGSAGLWFRRNGSLKTQRFTVGSLKHPVLRI